MLIALRIVFGAAFVYYLATGWDTGPTPDQKGDLANAFNLAVLLVLGLVNAMVWAPYLGAKIAGPFTGVLTDGTYVERRNHLLRLVYWLQDRGCRRLTVFFCFLEGIHHPDLPAAFAIGLKNAKPGSWFEKVYARELFRFDNAQNCIQAFAALKRHGLDPGRHHNPEINIVLLSLGRAAKPEPSKIVVPTAPSPQALRRNPQIRLFGKPDANQVQATEALSGGPTAGPASGPDDSQCGSEPAKDGEEVMVAQTAPPIGSTGPLGAKVSLALNRIWSFLRGD